MASSNSLFTVTSFHSHRCITGKLSYCQHWYFPLYWAGNALSVQFNWLSYMHMFKWWYPSNKHWTAQLVIDSWQIGQHHLAIKLIQLSCLPGLLSQRRVSSKLTTAHQAANSGKNWMKPAWLMIAEMLAGWKRQKPAAKMRGQPGSPRNSKDLLHNWTLVAPLCRTRTKTCSSSASLTHFPDHLQGLVSSDILKRGKVKLQL